MNGSIYVVSIGKQQFCCASYERAVREAGARGFTDVVRFVAGAVAVNPANEQQCEIHRRELLA